MAKKPTYEKLEHKVMELERQVILAKEKETEELVRRSEEQLRQIAENIHEVFYI